MKVPQHALNFYNALADEAILEDGVLIYKGGVTTVYDTLKLSRSHYTRIVKILEELGSIQFVQKGNAWQGTVLALHGAPDLEALSENFRLTKPSAQRRMRDDTLTRRVETIERRLGDGIDYVAALVNIEERLIALEGQAGINGTQGSNTDNTN